jgi:non-specific serine/threonine protein kinase
MTPARGPDPCGRQGMAGKARVCFDTFSAGSHGPALVVVPGLNGGKPYAMSRTEISVSDLNRYCVATHQCDAVAVPDADTGNAPARNITLSQARGYAIWLSRLSGYVYRLPTDEEWVHAADADSGWKRAADSDCLAPSEHSLFGASGPDATRGREANPWGLLNMSGSVWEWVTSGTTITVRGGGFDSNSSECSVDSHRADNGSRHRDVGFRLLRELK